MKVIGNWRLEQKKSYYNKKLKPLARGLRKHGTRGEAILWSQVLKAKNFHGLRFNRQFPIDNYIADFICRKLKLIIEVDGSSHDYKKDKDRKRDLRLNELGYRVVRISESDVVYDLNNAIKIIESALPEDVLNKDDQAQP